MTDAAAPGEAGLCWADAAYAAALLAVDPAGLGGAVLRAAPGPVRDRWLRLFRERLPEAAPVRRMPAHISDDGLLGGLDLPATLRAGRPVARAGLLAEAHGGAVVVPMAERLSAGVAARLRAVLDEGRVRAARDGLVLEVPARLGVVALDEGAADEAVPPALADRLALHLDLHPFRPTEPAAVPDAAAVAAARARLTSVSVGDDVVETLSAAAVALGADSLRAPLLAVRAARAAAALAGRGAVAEADAARAALLVLAPRATRLPQAEPEAEQAPDAPVDNDRPPDQDGESGGEAADGDVQETGRAVLPPGLLEQLKAAARLRAAGPSTGRAPVKRRAQGAGRPAGVRLGAPPPGARLAVVETLRAAAPLQRLRGAAPAEPLRIRPEDFRHQRTIPRTRTTTIFAVDASGSAALARLAEAKGAVELLLADCYVRRDRVAVIAFRGTGADLLLPPTRSLARARRSLSALPGGGGTPLAAGLDAALAQVEAALRRGERPVVVVLTDGRANVCRNGTGGRRAAAAEAEAAARSLRASGAACLVVDTANRPDARAEAVAAAMAARYLALPRADAATLSRAARAAGEEGGHAVSA
ncbi:magnesium chelatase subunit D [Caenispirillum salinarum]|uniref:magnesium chelatase subunit D n=1 Tax=Caenispirillum salinarum TaxID=859058 RepID=UPI0038506AA6